MCTIGMLYYTSRVSFYELDLLHVGLTSIHHRAFCKTYGIWTLDISRNNLTQLPYLFTLLEKIGRLRAQRNKINSIPFGYFNDFVNLHALSLSANRLGLESEPDFSPLANTLRDLGEHGDSQILPFWIMVNYDLWMLDSFSVHLSFVCFLLSLFRRVTTLT